MVGGGGGGQGGCEWRSKVFVKIKQNNFFEGGWVGVGGVGGGGGGGVRSGIGVGEVGGSKVWVSKVWVRWMMWGLGDVNKE